MASRVERRFATKYIDAINNDKLIVLKRLCYLLPGNTGMFVLVHKPQIIHRSFSGNKGTETR
jgi:hypothetical protein